jgi:hypothetical protein
VGSFLQGTGGEVRRVQTVKGWEKSKLVTSQVAHTHWLAPQLHAVHVHPRSCQLAGAAPLGSTLT